MFGFNIAELPEKIEEMKTIFQRFVDTLERQEKQNAEIIRRLSAAGYYDPEDPSKEVNSNE